MATQGAGPLRTLEDLLVLLRLSKIEIEEEFKELHHFSRHPPFKSRPLRFSSFVTYCEGLSQGIKEGEENEQTIQRTYLYVELRRTRSHTQALQEAWRTFPLAGTR